MGLDMYLDKTLFISEFDKDKTLTERLLDVLEVKDESGNYKHVEIKMPAIYWRKANQIHKWFVNMVQGGKDDCEEYDVADKHLERLLADVNTQLETRNKIILSPQSGFFFGSTDIDEYYWEDLEDTKKSLERELKFMADEMEKKRFWRYSYRASW